MVSQPWVLVVEPLVLARELVAVALEEPEALTSEVEQAAQHQLGEPRPFEGRVADSQAQKATAWRRERTEDWMEV